MTVHANLIDCIGTTPVVPLPSSLVPPGRQLFMKVEYTNPNFSIKDRTALGLVQSALAGGKLAPGGTLIESTSGNLGKSLAMLGAILGFRVIVVVDPKVSASVLNWYRAYGAEVDLVERPDQSGGYQKARIARVQRLLEENPGAYWPNQYENLDNSDYHYATTGPEVMEDVRAIGADAVVGSVSTGGHLCGIGRWIKRDSPQTRVIASDIAGSCVFGGSFSPYLINGVGLSWRSANTDLSIFDGIVIASDVQSISVCHLVAREHGLLLGGSSGLVLFAALTALRQDGIGSVLAILPDSGVNYLDQFYDKAWLAAKQVVPLSREQLAAELDAARIEPAEVAEYSSGEAGEAKPVRA